MSSQTTERYISFTVHVTNEDFQLGSLCLQTAFFLDVHTSEEKTEKRKVLAVTVED